MSALTQDLRHAVRQLLRRPGFTATAVLTLAIGMGVNTVAFTVVNGLLFKGFTAAARPGVGRVTMTGEGDQDGYASLAEFQRVTDATRGALDLAAEGRLTMAWRHDNATDTAWVLAVSSNYFSMVAADVLAGRLRVDAAPGAAPSAVVGERFWRDRLGAPSLANLTLRLNDTDVSVAGILPESFTGPGGLYAPDVWLPLDTLPLFHPSPSLAARDARWLFLLGRVQDATTAEVQGLVDTAAAGMARDWPDTHRGRGARFHRLDEPDQERRGLSRAASIGMAVIGLVLLLACFNVATLLVARGVERERDLGVRAALGAGPGRLMRLVVAEGVVLALASGALAVVLAFWTGSLVGAFAIPVETPQHIDLTPDGRVLGFVALLVVIAGVLPGLWPAVAATRVDVSRSLGAQGSHASGGRPSTLGRWLVAAQVAGSTAFLAVAALLVQSYGGLAAADMGFARGQLIVAEFEPAAHGYSTEGASRLAAALLDRVRALPGVTGAALADRAPFFIGIDEQVPVSLTGDPCDATSCQDVPTFAVGAGYFQAMGIPLVEGREPAGPGAAEVVVDQAFARAAWSAGDGLGRTIRVGAGGGAAMTVVGVTGRLHTRGLDRETPTLFLPLGSTDFDAGLTIVARTTAPPADLTRPVIAAAEALAPDVPLAEVKTMDDRMAVPLWPFRTVSWMFSICAALALLLAAVGLAGLVIHAVTRRVREFGVRMSLGATPGDIVRGVLAGSLTLVVPGLAAGLLLAGGAARLTRAVFVGVDVLAPWTYVAVAIAQCAIIVLASLVPALRAGRVDPIDALRAD